MKIGMTESGDAGLDQSWRDRLGEVDGAILITKAPHLITDIPDNCILHCTITGFAGTKLEPGVADLNTTLDAYHKWAEKIGGTRCVLRVDPVIPTEKGILRATQILEHANQHARSRVRISFLDLYPHAIERFKQRGLPTPWSDFHAPLETRKAALEKLQKHCNTQLEICGEPGFDCTGCLSSFDLGALGLPWIGLDEKSQQRKACACLGAKKELLRGRHPCKHNCAYCYWKD